LNSVYVHEKARLAVHPLAENDTYSEHPSADYSFHSNSHSTHTFSRIRAFPLVCEASTARVVALTGGALTSPKSLKFEKKSSDHETIFLNHYDWLLDWARQHTQGALEEAEDLVQDLYVRFVQMKSGPTFTDDDQIRAYLYTSLRNLFISKKLRNGRDAVSGLLAVDFDSVAFAMSAVDRSQVLYVRSDLAGICEYACIRRKTSRAASALILRFFLGYLSTEVMALLKTKRSNLDTLIETARLEAKAYLNRPGVLRFLSRTERKSTFFPRYLPEQPEALFAELQRRIFSETEGTCLSLEELENRYLRTDAPGFSTREVTHLASCRTCLHRASRILGLPNLMLRSFTEGDSEGTNPPSASNGEEGLEKLRRRLREAYEHRPKKLQIAVDGEVRGVQTITGALSKLQIKLPPLSKPGFVEVLSEQGVGLLYFDLQQERLEVPAPRIAAVDLSDKRQLSVSLTLVGGSLVIDLSYHDPLLEFGIDGPTSTQAPVLDPLDPDSLGPKQGRIEASPKHDGWFSRFLSLLTRRGPWIIAIAVGTCVLIVLHLVYVRTPSRTTKQVTAATILARSQEQTAKEIPPHGAVHEIFSLEVRSRQGTMTGSAAVDLLRSADRPLQTLRLRTTSGKLLASHWTDVSGKVRDFTNAEKPKPGLSTSAVSAEDTVWRHLPDAADFAQLADNRDLELRKVQDGYEISFKRPATSGKDSIVEGHLVVAAPILRPVSETLLVQRGEGFREYRFRELRYEILRPDQVTPSDFVPDAYVYRAHRWATAAKDVRLTLEALEILGNQPKNIQVGVDLERHPDGGIDVTGVLPTRQDARSLIRSFRSLRGGTIFQLDIHSADEPLTRRRPSAVELSPSVSIVTDHIPMENMLRASRPARSGGSGAELDDHVRQAARELVARGARVRRAAWVIRQIGSRDFRIRELAAMSAEDKQLWLVLLAHPLLSCDTELNAIKASLAGDGNSVPPQQEDTPPIRSVRELALAAESFRQNAARLDRLLVAGFALSPEVSATAVNKTELFDQLAMVQREERRLALTVQRLQQGLQVHRSE
jgi:DNA-directed RNA polymerase specialized sigma24 family protein